jgi:hypothetical protein
VELIDVFGNLGAVFGLVDQVRQIEEGTQEVGAFVLGVNNGPPFNSLRCRELYAVGFVFGPSSSGVRIDYLGDGSKGLRGRKPSLRGRAGGRKEPQGRTIRAREGKFMREPNACVP